MLVKKLLFQKIPFIKKFYKDIDNQYVRDEFIIDQLSRLKKGVVLLDAGCGKQPYRKYCDSFDYRAQDFGGYSFDNKTMIEKKGRRPKMKYEYGELDYIGNIWNINEVNSFFDAILCTEVFEHIPHPIDTLKEFSRLLKKDGILILTAPSSCLRHMDPFFFYSGFSDRWFEKFLNENEFKIEIIEPIGDYYRWLAVEMVRTSAANTILAKVLLAPAFLYFYLKKRTQESVDTLCMGYHIVARKVS